VSAPRRNLELKAIDPDPAETLRAALALGAHDEGTLHQRDIYFHAVTGRLKLREQLDPPDRPAELISYARPDRPDARISTYRVVTVHDPQALAEALNDVLGVRTVVEKRRRLLIHHDTRIHLDDVEGLGTFVELESTERDERRVQEIRDALAITEDRLIPSGYADMLERRGRA
jgi:predicted adenylyl cyclase CyaB